MQSERVSFRKDSTSKQELQQKLDRIFPLLEVDVIRWEEPLPASVQRALLDYLFSISKLGIEFPPELTVSRAREAHVLLSCTPADSDHVGNKHWIDTMDLAAEYSAALARYAKQLKHDIQFYGEHDVTFDEESFPA